jgi:hypothetical protein
VFQSFEGAAKKLLKQIGQNAGFSCENEHRLKMEGLGRYVAYIDHVWLEKVPHPSGLSIRTFPVVAFEITTNLGRLWNMKEMKGDVENLRLSSAALGVLIIPTLDALKKEGEEKKWLGAETWLRNLDNYLKALKMMAFPLRLEVWCFDQKNNKFSTFPFKGLGMSNVQSI